MRRVIFSRAHIYPGGPPTFINATPKSVRSIVSLHPGAQHHVPQTSHPSVPEQQHTPQYEHASEHAGGGPLRRFAMSTARSSPPSP